MYTPNAQLYLESDVWDITGTLFLTASGQTIGSTPVSRNIPITKYTNWNMIVLDSFCGNGTHLSEAWRDHGLTHCFIDTVGSSVLFGFILIFGGAQILVYRKYSTALEAIWRPKSCLYQMQILLCVLMSVESLLHFTLKATVLGDKTVYVHDILSTCFITLAWPLAIAVTCLERKRLLPSIPTRGHGLVLLVFWSLAFILENVAFISWFSRDWWWQNRE